MFERVGHGIGMRKAGGDQMFGFEIQPNQLLVVRFHDKDNLRTIGGTVWKVDDVKIYFQDVGADQS